MPAFKTVYTVLLTAWLFLVGAYSVAQLLRGAEPRLSWLGLTLAALGPLACLIRLRLPPRGRAPHHLGYTVLGGLGLAICMALSWRFGPAAGALHVWAGACLLAWVVYLRFIGPGFGSPRPD